MAKATIRRRRNTQKKRKAMIGKKSRAAKGVKNMGKNTRRNVMRKMRGGADGFYGNNVLLIIDPQNDFVKEGGALVVPGAVTDIDKLCNYLERNPDFFKEIHVSLDSHTMNHIAHAGFWEKGTNPYWGFRVNNGVIEHFDQASNDTKPIIDVKANPVGGVDLTLFAKTYIELMNNLPEGKTRTKPVPCRWPEHCIKHNSGWEIVETLKKVLDSEKFNGKVSYHEKGTNDLVEMYSIFSAEVTFEAVLQKLNSEKSEYAKDIRRVFNGYDGAIAPEQVKGIFAPNATQNYDTKFNIKLFKQLFGEPNSAQTNDVYICGEAKTHCVKTTIEDLYNTITVNINDKNGVLRLAGYSPQRLQKLISKIHIIDNATSSIVFPDIFVKPMQESFFEMSKNGVKICEIDQDKIQDLENEDKIKKLYGIEDTVPTTNNV
jgi:nicotinamidase-related amidase